MGESVSGAVELSGVGVRAVGRPLLADIDWRVDYGQHWVVLGPNGAGKTTLLSLVAAVRHPTEGVAAVLGQRLGRVDLRELRRHIGLVAASQRLVDEALLEEEGATAHTVVLTGHTGTSAPLWDRYGPAQHERAHTLLADLGCKDLADRLFSVCSQGERARIRVARALMADPVILLLDEPFAGLDLPAREDLITAVEDLAVTRPALTTVTVTHHLEEVPATTTHALLMRDTRIQGAGPVAEILTGENLSECFGRRLRIDNLDGRWYARAVRR
ncbi:ATP-binding cassette domain-containing protein [Streptosporangium sp. NBC_01639]|uniref:ABC transporter ATP-binding protein n=1 Tax=unclassified Streptosporangium TaxID=2632669 RepID=UPI002DD95A6D|nr:ATP-binding cassette domain-containing protein [Streptosporangium sp. NBC_01756]WSC85721.1 ATP-binding cassette domain-containing protein [Streptosporangium sp. NBC_01756]WTD55606.1 ATP-binding cassette domain-containing protein [Streptosporangium sp. NBC_01639]